MDEQIGKRLITISEAAHMLGVHPRTLRRWDASGKLPSIRFSEEGQRFYEKDVLKRIKRKGKLAWKFKGLTK